MANTYTQFYVHLVFSPKNRQALIQKSWKNLWKNILRALYKTINIKYLLSIQCLIIYTYSLDTM
jgi:REP element-mobilizing transposase RayT